MKITKTYTEKYNKNHEIDIVGTKQALDNEALSKITIQERGLCTIDEKVYEYMQITAYWNKDEDN